MESFSRTVFEPASAPAAAEVRRPRELHGDDFRAMRKYSRIYGLDYRLVLSVARQESRFDRMALSPKGAMGLLQIMPATERQLSSELDLDLSHPAHHIRAGVYYLAKLADLFSSAPPRERLRLAVAAYNAGPSRIYDAQELAAYLGENPDTWASIRHVLPLLSKRYASLHAHVWTEGRPPHGVFGGWRETVHYVDQVMAGYEGPGLLASR